MILFQSTINFPNRNGLYSRYMARLENYQKVSFPKKQQQHNARIKFRTSNLANTIPENTNQLSYALPTVISSKISV